MPFACARNQVTNTEDEGSTASAPQPASDAIFVRLHPLRAASRGVSFPTRWTIQLDTHSETNSDTF